MPAFQVTRQFEASPESIWRVVLAYESWPEWSPLFQLVRPEEPERGLQSEWTLNGLLGRVPYSGLFRQIEHRPLETFSFTSIRVSPPYDSVCHTFTLGHAPAPNLTWRVEYTTSGGPGGWIVDRLLIRRQTLELLERGIEALATELHKSRITT